MTRILKHPLVILISVVIGVLVGLYDAPISAVFSVRSFVQLISMPGQVFLFYLQMTVIPIIITAISSSIGKLMRNKTSLGLIKRMVIVFLAGIVLTALAGMAVGILGRPGAGLGEDTRSLLTNLISSQTGGEDSKILEVTLSGAPVVASAAKTGLETFLTSLIPSNIFSALAIGSTMAVVFFSIVFGIAIGFVNDQSADMLIKFLSAIFETFQKLVSASLYLLPFGLICLMAGQIAQVGILVFMAMSKFIILYCVGTAVLFIITTVIIWVRSGIANPFKVLSLLFEPIMLAFATRNSMATLPSSITCLDDKMSFDKTTVNLTLPLGMTLGRFGNVFYFAVAVFFVVQIYGIELTAAQYATIFIGVIFAGTATAGASGIVTLSVISIVLSPLNLPVEAVLVIFMAIDPIIDPFRTFLLVYENIGATTMIAGKKNSFGTDTLSVIIRKNTDRRPVLYHDAEGNLTGIEIGLLREIARRLDKKLFIQEGAPLDGVKTNIIGGCVIKTEKSPPGLIFSQSYGIIKEQNVKMELCLLLTPFSVNSVKINGIIKKINAEHFFRNRNRQSRNATASGQR
ncbi:MAG: cation:dicarboxylase symporter family transporter [Spirochaetaceae bacterium]|jgi:proton glutamate symport protein|nr:cation:dicarboxylase symporter family transporter [Spirochaetaceae bacterium]